MIAPDYENSMLPLACLPPSTGLLSIDSTDCSQSHHASQAKPVALSIYFYNFIYSRNFDLSFVVLGMGFTVACLQKAQDDFFLE